MSLTAGAMIRMPGVTALTLAGSATLSDGTTFATFAKEPSNKSAVEWNAKRRKPDLLGRYCKAVLVCKELEEVIQQTTGSTEASPQAHSTALVPVVPVCNPPQPPRNRVEPGAAQRRPPELAPEPELQPKTFADSARTLLKTTLQAVFATVRAKILATLIVIFFPQLVTKLLLRCVKHALITASTEAVGTLVQATEQVDLAMAPVFDSVFGGFNHGLDNTTNAPGNRLSMAMGFLSFLICQWARATLGVAPAPTLPAH